MRGLKIVFLWALFLPETILMFKQNVIYSRPKVHCPLVYFSSKFWCHFYPLRKSSLITEKKKYRKKQKWGALLVLLRSLCTSLWYWHTHASTHTHTHADRRGGGLRWCWAAPVSPVPRLDVGNWVGRGLWFVLNLQWITDRAGLSFIHHRNCAARASATIPSPILSPPTSETKDTTAGHHPR